MKNDIDTEIAKAFKTENDQALQELLLQAHNSNLNPIYSIAYGLTEMMPPFEDYQLAADAFCSLYGTKDEKIAAIFNAYIYVNLQPINDAFIAVLQAYEGCEIANYMLAQYYEYIGNCNRAREYLDKSLSQRQFPSNILLKLSFYSNGLNETEIANLKQALVDLVVDKQFELSSEPAGAPQLVDAHLKELVLSFYMTSINWEMTAQKHQLK
ncbi:MAG: hypothetical protein HRT35_00610 [Algicola sp.]|nr:hypothetical protein [Algicola sp.]